MVLVTADGYRTSDDDKQLSRMVTSRADNWYYVVEGTLRAMFGRGWGFKPEIGLS